MERPKDEKSFTGWGNQSFLVISSSIVHSDSLLGRNGVMTTPTNDKEFLLWVSSKLLSRTHDMFLRCIPVSFGRHRFVNISKTEQVIAEHGW